MDKGDGPSKPTRKRRKRNPRSDNSDNDEKEIQCNFDSDSESDSFDEFCDESSGDETEEQSDWTTATNAHDPLSTGTSPWTTTCQLVGILFNKPNTFTGTPSGGTTAIDFFDLLFTEEFLEMICRETNSNAERRFLQSCVKVQSRITRWKDLTVPELKKFLGLLFHMGTIEIVHLQDYWKKDRLFSIPIFGEQMSRNRFALIIRCLHFSSGTDRMDPLAKIMPVLTHFNNTMMLCYYPGKDLCLDEGMEIKKGRLKFYDYTRDRRNKPGVKLFMLTEPDGLVLKVQAYTNNPQTERALGNFAQKVALDLLEEKLNNGHSVYMDEFYSSISLSRILLGRNTYSTGILRQNLKENPKEVVRHRLKKGENISRFQEDVHVGMWRDKWPVAYITTQFADNMTAVLHCNGLSRKPEAVAKYDECLSREKLELLLSYCPCERKSMRWYLKVNIHIFHLMLMNSHKLYNKCSGRVKLSLHDYRQCVIEALLPEKAKQRDVVDIAAKLAGAHKISRIEAKNSRGQTKRKCCAQCSLRCIRKDTIWQCIYCDKEPGLCVECFHPYHAELGILC